MDSDNDLIARIQQYCLALSRDDSGLYRLMCHPVRRLLDHSGVVVHLQPDQAPGRIIGFDVSPRLVRALRLAARMVNHGSLLSQAPSEAPVFIEAERLRTFPLGPHLRALASGHLILQAHTDLVQASRCAFVFIGVRSSGPEERGQLERVLKAITPTLHRVVLQTYHIPNSPIPLLTRAEREVCRLLIAGSSNKQIASTLDKSEATVRNQLHVIFVKLHVGTRIAAAARLRELWSRNIETRGKRSAFMEHLYY